MMLTPQAGSPAALGYRMPAEWEPHEATWLAWPHNRDTWPGKFEPIPAVWAALVSALAAHEPVRILAGGAAVTEEARRLVGNLANVRLLDIATNDCWTRDYGPIFLVGPPGAPRTLIDWEYNAWGGKYPPFDRDNRVPEQIAAKLEMRRLVPGIVMEGGAIDVNGRGTILTTEQCLLNPNRNPTLDRGQIEQYLADYLGARQVLWLGGGIEGDDTDGHIDELARFVSATTVVAAVEEDPADANYQPLRDNLRRLQSFKDQDGRALEVVPLPMPRPIYVNNQRLPASYANFYIANGVVIVPQFNDPADRQACQTLSRLLPDRKIVGQVAVDLAWGLGAYHCISQQQPAGQL